MKTHIEKWKTVITAAGIFLLLLLLCYTQIFDSWDKSLHDKLCQRATVPSKKIFIIAIDDKTLSKYGPLSGWSRDISTDLVNRLCADQNKKPAVIGFDVMFIENTQKQVDQRFALACKKAGNVVTAMNFRFKEQPEKNENGQMIYDSLHVYQANFPYQALKQSCAYGFANTIADGDGYVRRAMSQVNYKGKPVYSLAVQVYRNFMEFQGQKPHMPAVDEDYLFSFQYACKTGEYSVISLCDVLDGTVDPKIFQDGIVMAGAYAVGLQDSYLPAISHSQQMYGVEIQANIVDALLNGRTKQDVPIIPYALIAALIGAGYFLLTRKIRITWAAVTMLMLTAASIVVVKVVYMAGYSMPVLILPASIMIIYLAVMLQGYLDEVRRRKKVVEVFKQYVAPQVVDDISKKRDFKVTLGGEKRQIAVLFVDIRGFTTMSESMNPEQVVEILNEYLSLTTDSIFRNSGTLDKFIGDATMALFNSPFELDDYVYKAVKTAWDMKQGTAALAEKFKDRYHSGISFGIGVHCGEAVVGNIGCDFRMDYTAIGDTVNTASRLESNARSGQILISNAVYEAVKERVAVTPIGKISLKGKNKGVFVYQVDEVK